MPKSFKSASVRHRSPTPVMFCAEQRQSNSLYAALAECHNAQNRGAESIKASKPENEPLNAFSHFSRPSLRRYWHVSSTPHCMQSEYCCRRAADVLFSGVLKPPLEIKTASNGRFRFSMFIWQTGGILDFANEQSAAKTLWSADVDYNSWCERELAAPTNTRVFTSESYESS